MYKYEDILKKDIRYIRNSTGVTDIRYALKRAFEGSAFTNKQLKLLYDAAEQYRQDKTSAAKSNLIYIFQKSLYTTRVIFLEDENNKNLKKIVTGNVNYDTHKDELVNEYINKANELLGFDKIKEESNKIYEEFLKLPEIERQIDLLNKEKEKKDKQEVKLRLKESSLYNFARNNLLKKEKDGEIEKKLFGEAKFKRMLKQKKEEVERIKKRIELDVFLAGEFSKKESEQIEDLINEKGRILDEVKNNSENFVEKIKEFLLQNSSISENKAKEWVDNNIVLDNKLKNFIAKEGINEDAFKQALANIYRIVNGKIDKPITITHERNGCRSWANGYTRILCLNTSDFGTLFHEMGHFVEYDNRELFVAARNFIEKRATGKPASLKSITGFNYRRSERAYPDHFSNAYVGKIYDHEATEVISMGLEYLESKKEFIEGLKDPEHIKLSIGCFLSRKLPQFNYHGSRLYSNSDIEYTEKILGNDEWQKNVSAMITQEFKDKISSEGIDGLQIMPSKLVSSGGASKILVKGKADSKYVFETEEVYKLAYLAICHYRKLLEYNIPGTLKKILDELVDYGSDNFYKNAPKWFTPSYIMPKVI